MTSWSDPPTHFQLFRILLEVVRGGASAGQRRQLHARPVPQHREKIPGQIRSVLNVQEMTARALLVDRATLEEAQHNGDVLRAHSILMDAFYTDVRPDLASWRASRGLPPDPLAAYLASGYSERIAKERTGGAQAGWGASTSYGRRSRRSAWSRTRLYAGAVSDPLALVN